MIPTWITVLSAVFLVLGLMCSAWLLMDVRSNPPHMKIMQWVWPLCGLFGHVFVLWLYCRYARMSHQHMSSHEHHEHHHQNTPFVVSVAKGTLHCGSGCTLGDIIAEWLAFAMPGIAIALGWQHWTEHKIFAVWILDFVLALGIGIIFQYFAIKPMRDVNFWQGIKAACKADILSLTAWQVGMYGFMAFAHFYLFADVLNVELAVNTLSFWFMMQIAMLCGFVTAYPVNAWLIKSGIKEAM